MHLSMFYFRVQTSYCVSFMANFPRPYFTSSYKTFRQLSHEDVK